MHDHEDTHTHGIDDECPSCQKYVDHPTTLDATNLRRIWSGEIKTRRDMEVYNHLYRCVVQTQKLGEAFAVAEWERAGGELRDAHKPDAFELFQHGGRS